MGFWANLKAKRAHKSALREYEISYADWERDVEIFTKIKEAFALAAKGEDAASNLTVQKPGEFVL